jgi:hypothetical protein
MSAVLLEAALSTLLMVILISFAKLHAGLRWSHGKAWKRMSNGGWRRRHRHHPTQPANTATHNPNRNSGDWLAGGGGDESTVPADVGRRACDRRSAGRRSIDTLLEPQPQLGRLD